MPTQVFFFSDTSRKSSIAYSLRMRSRACRWKSWHLTGSSEYRQLASGSGSNKLLLPLSPDSWFPHLSSQVRKQTNVLEVHASLNQPSYPPSNTLEDIGTSAHIPTYMLVCLSLHNNCQLLPGAVSDDFTPDCQQCQHVFVYTL